MEVNVQRLKQLREEQALSLRELAGRADVAHNVIWRIENGKTGAQPRTIRKLAAALGVETKELVKRSGDA
jgi:transcriptional regulator with XRE-family HTH domain